MSTISFTVVIPVHNGANYIADAVNSILQQTYPPEKIIILENQSTDNTLEILSRFHDPRIHIVPSATFLNIQDNWSRIGAQPLTEYFTLMGHDDILYPEFLAHMAALITREPEASLYQAVIEEIDSAGRPVRRHPAPALFGTADEYLRAVLHADEEVCGTGCVMRAATYREIGGIPPFANLLYADVVLWYRLVARSFRVSTLTPLVGYRVHSENAHQHFDAVVYYDALSSFAGFLRSTEVYRDESEMVERYLNDLFNRICRRAARQLINRDTDAQLSQFDQVKVRAREEQNLSLTDGLARLYLILAHAPFPIRSISSRAIQAAAGLRRMIRHQQRNDKGE
jgi:glycosyltransferase involved in cell wall biosynthesis